EPGTREKDLDTSALAAVAPWSGKLLGGRPGQGIMSPLSGDEVRALDAAAIHDDSSTHSSAKDDAEHDAGARGRAIAGLGEREAVGVIGKPHRPAEPHLEVRLQRLSDEPHRV